MTPVIPVLNAGSSSVKFSILSVAEDGLRLLFHGAFDGIGTEPHFCARDAAGATIAEERFPPAMIATQEISEERPPYLTRSARLEGDSYEHGCMH